MYFIFWYDYALAPIYLVIAITFLNFYFRKKHGINPQLKRHFNRGLFLKLFGCISIGLIYEYYYNGAYDGRFYYDCAKMLTAYWKEYPDQLFHVLFNSGMDFDTTNLKGIRLQDVNIHAEASFFVGKVAAVFNIFSFNAFLPCSVFFCVIAFLGLWNFYIFLIREFKLDIKVAALCTLYLPSVLVWDSSIFKDTICFTALCWLFVCSYYLFIKPRKIIANALGFIVAAFFISQIKVYILAAFAPFLILYVFFSYKARITNPALKRLSTPFILGISITGILFFLFRADDLLGRYALEEVLETAALTASEIGNLKAGSTYSLNVDLSSPLGVLTVIPFGINVTLFRPYPWEYLSPFILFASAESMLFLYFTVSLIYKLGIGKTFHLIRHTPILQFTLFFSLLFAFMVGISSSNFGSLVRYKIPILPFYALFLALLHQALIISKKQTKLVRARKSISLPVHLK